MFEEKINLNIKKIDNVVEKEIYGQKVKFHKYLSQEECQFIIGECVENFIKTNNDEKNFSTSIMSVLQTMNICLCYLATNINVENVAYEDLCAIGIFKNIEETLINYKEIKEEVILSISLLFDYLIYDTLEKLPTTKQMTDNLTEIKDFIISNPEKAKEYANIIIANHPELKGFGNIFENIVNRINKQE